MKAIGLILVLAAGVSAQRPVEFEERKGMVLENDRLELIMLSQGGAFVSLVLKDDPEKMSPLWNPIRAAREAGRPPRFGSSIGHFTCVDGFGGVSREEQAAGLPGHGEACRVPWEMITSSKQDGKLTASYQAKLPLVQEIFHRKVTMVDGEHVIAVESELESLVAFDRPFSWAEHATIGVPFLTPEKTTVNTSAGRCQVRPAGAAPPRTIQPGAEFKYPLAPRIDGTGNRDVTFVPAPPNSQDHTACTVDPARERGWVTALRTDKRLLIGYVWRRDQFPWIQQWMNFPSTGDLAWGLEFGTQPYDLSRRTVTEMGSLLGVPSFRMLPAKSKVPGRFLMFFTRVPEGFNRVDDVVFEGGRIVVEDKTAGKKLELKTSATL